MTISKPIDLTTLTVNRKSDLCKRNKIEVSYIWAKRNNLLQIRPNSQLNLCTFAFTFNDKTKILIAYVKDINYHIASLFQDETENKRNKVHNRHRQRQFRLTNPEFQQTVNQLNAFKKFNFTSMRNLEKEIGEIGRNPQIRYSSHYYVTILQLVINLKTFKWTNDLKLRLHQIIENMLTDIVEANQNTRQ